LLIATALLLGGCGSQSSKSSSSAASVVNAGKARPARKAPAHGLTSLVPTPAGELQAGVQWPATATIGDRVLLMGGLDQATASVADISA
jgi:hypothetical protein